MKIPIIHIRLQNLFLLIMSMIGIMVLIRPVSSIVVSVMLGAVLGASSVMVFFIFRYGVYITIHKFYIGNELYRVIDHILPLDMHSNKRIIVQWDESVFHSAVFTNRHDTWAFFDTVRILLQKNPLKNFRRSLLIGAAGGSVAYTLAHDYATVHVDAIDISPEMKKVATTYFLKNRFSDQITYMIAEGSAYTASTKQTYDFIFVDGFTKNVISKELTSVSFIKSLKKILNPHGLVFINFGFSNTYSIAETCQKYARVFPNLQLYTNRGSIFGVVYYKKIHGCPLMHIQGK